MKRESLYFLSPGAVEVRQEPVPMPGPGEVLVKATCSAISSGTELLVLRGQFPTELDLDESISSLSGNFQYPLKYGYCMVGEIAARGQGVGESWIGKKVFSFQPHESYFTSALTGLMMLPEGISPEQAVFLPNMETAVNLVMDGRPMIGENVLVLGQGMVGLLVTGLLAHFPLDKLVTMDRFDTRRQAGLLLGASASLDPDAPQDIARMQNLMPEGADLVYELSGAPETLNTAIKMTGFAGRIVVGSWYGQKQAGLDLGGRFHRSRIQIKSSQVSTLAPELTGRWTKQRRFDLAWDMIRRLEPQRFITHRFPLRQAGEAYNLLDQHPEKALQILFQYEGIAG